MEKKYSEIIDGIDLLDVCLIDLEFKRHRLPNPEIYPEARASFSPKKISYKQSDDELDVQQSFEFILEEFGDGRNKSRKIFKLKATFSLLYSKDREIDEECFEAFKTRNIPLNLHPYARELIQNSMVRVGLPPFILPALKVKR